MGDVVDGEENDGPDNVFVFGNITDWRKGFVLCCGPAFKPVKGCIFVLSKEAVLSCGIDANVVGWNVGWGV